MREPSSNLLMFQAVTMWIAAYWLGTLSEGVPVPTALAVMFAIAGMGLAVQAARQAVPQPSPWRSLTGRVLWALRPRKWMLAWGFIIGLMIVFGRPMILNWYGGGRCQYIDWWLRPHVLPAQGDGMFQGCRFLAGW
jgi:hypothetical protein